MKKNDIIAVYAEKNNVTKKAATEVVGSVIDIIKAVSYTHLHLNWIL